MCTKSQISGLHIVGDIQHIGNICLGFLCVVLNFHIKKSRNLSKNIEFRGGVIIKNGKIWDNVPNRLDPPPLSDIASFLNFRLN